MENFNRRTTAIIEKFDTLVINIGCSEMLLGVLHLLFLLCLQASFQRPPPESDKLFMHLGEHDVIEVAHPQPPQGSLLPY